MKSLGPSFPCYHDDLLGGTQHMDAAEFGAYWLLLIHQWKEGRLPLDDRKLMLIGRLGAKFFKSHRKTILAKFVKMPDGYHNKRMDAIRAERIAYIDEQSRKGKLSAEQRFNRGSTVVQPGHQPEGEPEGQPKGNSPSPSPSPKEKRGEPPVWWGVLISHSKFEKLTYEDAVILFRGRNLNPDETLAELAPLLRTANWQEVKRHGEARWLGWQLDDLNKRRNQSPDKPKAQGIKISELVI